MNISTKSLTAGALMSALFFTATPLTSAAGKIRTTNRCFQLAGREKTRCNYTASRSARLRIRTAGRSIVKNKAVRRNNTLRDARVIRRNITKSDVRRIGIKGLERIRRHNKGGGRSRRIINTREQNARKACRYLKGTEKYQCIRKEWRGGRGGQ